MQASPLELNLRKEEWLVIPIDRPPLDSITLFVDSLAGIIGFVSSSYNNLIIIGDFNIQPFDKTVKEFIKLNGFISLIKEHTCFQGKGSCIDLILNNRRLSWKHSNLMKLV